MRSKKPKKIIKTEKSKKLSKLGKVKRLILENGFYRILNNQKWHTIFEIIIENNIVFKVKLLIDSDAKYCDFIRESNENSILIDDSSKFINFLEIDYIEINKNGKILEYLNNKKVKYFKDEKIIKIFGYCE